MDNYFSEDAQDELRTLRDMVRWTVSCFNASRLWYGHGSDNALDEALQLILPTLSLPPDLPSSLYDARLLRPERQLIIERVRRRIEERVPVAYLTQRAWFCGHEFYVDERVLIPRSPLGELIDNRFAALLHAEPQHILDLCTGSGCIAIACALAFPEAEVDAVDLSVDALNVAEINIDAYRLAHRVTPIRSDLFDDLPPLRYDLIVTNPPYVDEEDMADLPEEYRHEPELGLAAGRDGLQLVRRILAQAADYLTEEGILICEVGNSQVHLQDGYPDVPFCWLEFERGGEGVFMLSKAQLDAYRDRFACDSTDDAHGAN